MQVKNNEMLKIPHVDYKLYKKITKMIETNKKNVMIKTYARGSTIIAKFIGYTIHVHNGKGFIPVVITENHVGHKLGEFAATRRQVFKEPGNKGAAPNAKKK